MASTDATVAAAASLLADRMAGADMVGARGVAEGAPPAPAGGEPKLPAEDPEELFQEKPDDMEQGFYDDLISKKSPAV